jgi:hypothetical protein
MQPACAVNEFHAPLPLCVVNSARTFVRLREFGHDDFRWTRADSCPVLSFIIGIRRAVCHRKSPVRRLWMRNDVSLFARVGSLFRRHAASRACHIEPAFHMSRAELLLAMVLSIRILVACLVPGSDAIFVLPLRTIPLLEECSSLLFVLPYKNH